MFDAGGVLFVLGMTMSGAVSVVTLVVSLNATVSISSSK